MQLEVENSSVSCDKIWQLYMQLCLQFLSKVNGNYFFCIIKKILRQILALSRYIVILFLVMYRGILDEICLNQDSSDLLDLWILRRILIQKSINLTNLNSDKLVATTLLSQSKQLFPSIPELIFSHLSQKN